jgi:hypothetical protein
VLFYLVVFYLTTISPTKDTHHLPAINVEMKIERRRRRKVHAWPTPLPPVDDDSQQVQHFVASQVETYFLFQ